MGGWGMMDHFVDNKLLLSHSKAPACGAEEGGATELAVVGHRREQMPGWAGTARPSVLAACTWIVDSGHTRATLEACNPGHSAFSLTYLYSVLGTRVLSFGLLLHPGPGFVPWRRFPTSPVAQRFICCVSVSATFSTWVRPRARCTPGWPVILRRCLHILGLRRSGTRLSRNAHRDARQCFVAHAELDVD